MKKIVISIILGVIMISSSMSFLTSAYPGENDKLPTITGFDDFDPLDDINVTVDIQAIRSLEKFEYVNPKTFKKIDLTSDPDFFVKVYINDQEYVSQIWNNTKFIYDTGFSPTLNVPDDEEFVNVKIQLYDWNPNKDVLLDIAGEGKYDVDLTYSIKTGHWTGDDSIGDPSGYGRLNGCDDGSVYSREKDCEIWFNIYQNDFDGDGIPYWTEVNTYGTDPTVDNRGDDSDGDGIPIEWEWKWGYDPLYKDSFTTLDPDDDGLTDYEEYLVSQWNSDPFRQDIYIELDQMEGCTFLPDGSKELLATAFNRFNKVFHIDDGNMGGGEIIPYDEDTSGNELENIYWNYFLHGDNHNWRAGVFRYGLIVYWPGRAGFNFGHGAFVISSEITDTKVIPKTQKIKDIVYASVYMHEMGHGLRIRNAAVDQGLYPWDLSYWLYGPYKSTMFYRYTYRLVDYSDGSRGPRDFDDWDQLNLPSFQNPW